MTPRTSAPRSTLRLTGAAVIAACLALVGACSGGGKGKSTGEQEESPLSAYFSDLFGEQDLAKANAKQLQAEEAVARCMAEEGFEYTPVDYSALSETLEESTPEDDTRSREWAEKNGYGYSIAIDGEEPEGLAEFTDPNSDYINSLTESEQIAYYEALYGPSSEAEFETPPLSEQGCYGAAQSEVHGDGSEAFYESEEVDAFNEAITALEEEISGDPRQAKIDAAWASCMADAGMDGYASPDEASEDFANRTNAFWETLDWEALGPDEQPEPDPDLQKAERATAVADFDCKEKVGYQAAHDKIRFAKESEFIKTHQAELEALKDAYRKVGL
ncbi:hypothetical protein ET495_16325 [Xylanimonas allomyrinae]|uniref:Uncharacterized protein n=1 Tax=Xylanimonas allomyrinae TaxID=2509459 RepID=A0A4P6EVK0_9MICO|nr:hypothetical protein [Xylanimonas allomyrinae]QAY64517.1 hypothetical protein ET495_16325 [Xylanimonas allomyrinae]